MLLAKSSTERRGFTVWAFRLRRQVGVDGAGFVSGSFRRLVLATIRSWGGLGDGAEGTFLA